MKSPVTLKKIFLKLTLWFTKPFYSTLLWIFYFVEILALPFLFNWVCFFVFNILLCLFSIYLELRFGYSFSGEIAEAGAKLSKPTSLENNFKNQMIKTSYVAENYSSGIMGEDFAKHFTEKRLESEYINTNNFEKQVHRLTPGNSPTSGGCQITSKFLKLTDSSSNLRVQGRELVGVSEVVFSHMDPTEVSRSEIFVNQYTSPVYNSNSNGNEGFDQNNINNNNE